MNLPSQAEIDKMTPMMQQYYSLKMSENGRDAILFFRMGDFYEVFGDEAKEIAPKLDIVLTSRERGDKQKIPFCGVPHHSAQGYWLKLLRLGYRVAIAEQSTSGTGKLLQREIQRVLSPGCIDELEGLDGEQANYIMALLRREEDWALLLADISTGELRLGTCEDTQLAGMVELYQPRELVVRKYLMPRLRAQLNNYQEPLLYCPMPEAILKDEAGQLELMQEVFACKDLDTQPCGPIKGGRELVCALLARLVGLRHSLAQFLCVRPIVEEDSFALDDRVVRDLEFFATSRDGRKEGSLFQVINFSRSPMGARELRWALTHPLQAVPAITARQDAVSKLLQSGVLENLRKALSGLPDLERLSSRLLGAKIRPQELGRLRQGLGQALNLVNLVAGWDPALSRQLEAGRGVFNILDRALVDSPDKLGSGSGVFKPDWDNILATKLELAGNGNQKVDAYVDRLKQETGLTGLRVKSHKTFGLLLEVSKGKTSLVPDYFIRRQTMVNYERYTTVELKDLDESLSSADEEAVQREAELYVDLLGQCQDKTSLGEVAKALARVDFLQSLASLAERLSYVRPTLCSHEEGMELRGARHPVVEYFVGQHNFTPNDLLLRGAQKQMLITGPNMAGKSTVMRQVMLCAVLTQMGSYVPAVSARLPVFDGFFTRIGASDDLSRGRSTFMVEMNEVAQILRQAGSRSLVILDEVGRGTSSQDGLALAGAILEHFALNLKSWTMFATHYHELVGLVEALDIVALQTEVVEGEEGLRFTHRLLPGAGGRSYGLEVAALAGIPGAVQKRARELYKEGFPPVQTASQVEFELKELDLQGVTPMAALNKLQSWQRSLSDMC